MKKKKLLYTSLTALTLASAIGYHPAFAEDEANPDLEITLQSDTQDGSEDIVLDDDINIDDATNQKEELGDTTDKEEEKEEKVQKTFTASYTYLAIYYDTTNDKELSKDGYRVDIVKDEENPQVELSKTYYNLDGQEIDEADIVDVTKPIDIDGYEFVDTVGDGLGAVTGGTVSTTHNYKAKEKEKKEEKPKLYSGLFGPKVNEDVLPLKISLQRSNGLHWTVQTASLPAESVRLNLIVVDKEGKEVALGTSWLKNLKQTGSFSVKDFSDGYYTLIIGGSTGHLAAFQRYEGRMSFEVKDGKYVKTLDKVEQSDILSGVSTFPLKIEDVIYEGTHLINIRNKNFFNGIDKNMNVEGYIDWKPQKLEILHEIIDEQQNILHSRVITVNSQLKFSDSNINIANYPDGIYTIRMTGMTGEEDGYQKFAGYSAFEIRNNRYIGMIPVLVNPIEPPIDEKKEENDLNKDEVKKEDNNKVPEQEKLEPEQLPEIPKIDPIPEKKQSKENKEVILIPDDPEILPDNNNNQDNGQKKENQDEVTPPSSSEKKESTPPSSSENKSTHSPKSSTNNSSNNSSATNKQGNTSNNTSPSSNITNQGQTVPETQDETTPSSSDNHKKVVTTTTNRKLPSSGEVVSFLGFLGLAIIAIAGYLFKKRRD